MEFGIKKLCHADNEKEEDSNNERNRTVHARKYQNFWRKCNLKIEGILEVDTIKQTWKKKRKKTGVT